MPELPESLPEPAPWRPRSLAPAPGRRFSRGNSLLLAAIVAGHAGALYLLSRAMQARDVDAVDEAVTEVRFMTRAPDVEPIVIFPPELAPETLPASSSPPKSRDSRKPRAATALQAVAPTPERKPLPLFDASGRVKLPDGLMDDLEAKVGDKRVFDYQVPGLATAHKAFDRPVALVYEHNAFEDYYHPDQDMLTDLLTRMVEGTTKEVRIKIPGNPRAKVVCTISLLAFGGSCGVVQNRGNYYIHDDPETLSEQEQKQCQAWWDKIVDATSQDVWRKTRDLYESECRKPLERKPPVAPGVEPMPGRITQ